MLCTVEPGTPESAPLTGFAALADRAVDGRKVALVMGLVGLLLSGGSAWLTEVLLASANAEPDGGRMLRSVGHSGAPAVGPPARVVVVLLDGMRVDGSHSLESWARLAPSSVTAEVDLGLPTFSRPYYHHFLTGVPAHASGVRTNRFADHARQHSVADRVREAGGSVFIAAGGLDWMARMHARPQDEVDVGSGALGAPLDAMMERFREAAPPALFIVHDVEIDEAAHHDGTHGPAHARALEGADELVGRVAEALPEATLLVTSDHGHRENGGHGGDEPDVVRAPILWRAEGAERGALADPVHADSLAPTIAEALGVPCPRAASAPADARLTGRAPTDDPGHAHAHALVRAGRSASQLQLWSRRRWTLPLALIFLVMALGPIKRAWGFDRSVPLALLLGPALVVGIHLALGRPLTLSAIDERAGHAIRVACIGVVAAFFAIAIARRFSVDGDATTRTLRAAASVGWSAAAGALLSSAWAGFALGPWELGPHGIYAPLLATGAGSSALLVCAVVLFFGALWIRRRTPDRAPG